LVKGFPRGAFGALFLPDIDPSCWIAPCATIIGNVVVGSGSSIWFGSVVRGDNEPIVIGERINIQEGCILHSDPGSPLRIGNDTTVGHRAVSPVVQGTVRTESTIVLIAMRVRSSCPGENRDGQGYGEFSRPHLDASHVSVDQLSCILESVVVAAAPHGSANHVLNLRGRRAGAMAD
jgi:hypothetical protein